MHVDVHPRSIQAYLITLQQNISHQSTSISCKQKMQNHQKSFHLTLVNCLFNGKSFEVLGKFLLSCSVVLVGTRGQIRVRVLVKKLKKKYFPMQSCKYFCH